MLLLVGIYVWYVVFSSFSLFAIFYIDAILPATGSYNESKACFNTIISGLIFVVSRGGQYTFMLCSRNAINMSGYAHET